MTKDLKGDRWTCPNDRNLQLRSKLNAGWSCHTGKIAVQKDTQLTENELNEIQKVLQRSQAVERNERDRVMKLVERLENMKKNAQQSIPSPNKCALCGDYFCVLRSTSNKCAFCHRVLCSKCCIDSQYSVDNESSHSNGHSRRGSITSSLLSTNSKVFIWQCRLCSEQREFLKKSGAWFSKKSPPTYVPPEDGGGGNTKYNSTSNVSSIQNKQSSLQNIISSGTNLRRNLSSFSSNSLSFRFWNKKDDTDNYSDISMDNDLQTELHSNNDSTSLNNRTVSSENLINNKNDSPFNLYKTDKFTFSSTNGNNTNNSPYSRSPHSPVSPSSIKNSKNDNNSQNKFSFNTSSSSNFQKSFFPQKNNNDVNASSSSVSQNTKISPSFLRKNASKNNHTDSSFLDDDAEKNQNMANYNYYSNIITNLDNPESSTEDKNNRKNSSSNNMNVLKSISSNKITNNSNNNNGDDQEKTKMYNMSNSKFSNNPISFCKASRSNTETISINSNNKIISPSSHKPQGFANSSLDSIGFERILTDGHRSSNSKTFSQISQSSNNSDNKSINSTNSSDYIIKESNNSINNNNNKHHPTPTKSITKNSITSITNGILSNSLSASASSLNKLNSSNKVLSNKLNKNDHERTGSQGDSDRKNSEEFKTNSFHSEKRTKPTRITTKFLLNNNSNNININKDIQKTDSEAASSSASTSDVSGTSGSAISSAAASLNKFNLTKKT